jgi:Flp pilus assembly protein TadG
MLAGRLIRSTSGASAAEFGLVLPLFLILLFGVIDAGRFMWESNEAEKATQVGARVAVVTDPLSSGLRDEDYAGKVVGGTTLAAGALIPAAALGSIKCTSTGCTCETAPCPSSLGTFNTTLFTNVVVTRMKQMYPSIQAANVVVRYKGSGFGFAEAASGGGGGVTEQMEISPLVTVTLTGVQFRPLTTFALKSVTMPDFATTLTAEDASGSVSN